jgi:hypothetical protein
VPVRCSRAPGCVPCASNYFASLPEALFFACETRRDETRRVESGLGVSLGAGASEFLSSFLLTLLSRLFFCCCLYVVIRLFLSRRSVASLHTPSNSLLASLLHIGLGLTYLTHSARDTPPTPPLHPQLQSPLQPPPRCLSRAPSAPSAPSHPRCHTPSRHPASLQSQT